MKPEQLELLHIFDEHVFGAMRFEVEFAMRAGAARLAALGLVTYTEFLGGLATGHLGQRGHSAANFRAFVPYLGADYSDLERRGVDIYDVVRSGLVHEYFIKGRSRIAPEGVSPCGIVSSPGGPTYFLVGVYRDEVFRGARQLRDDLLSDDTALQQALGALRRVGVSF